jgi:hypothetical protein
MAPYVWIGRTGSQPAWLPEPVGVDRAHVEHADMSTDDLMIDTPDGPMTFAEWKKKHPVQVPSRRTKGKDLPVKVKRFTDK